MKLPPLPFITLALAAALPAQDGSSPVPDIPRPEDKAIYQSGSARLIAVIHPVGKSNVRGTVLFEKTAGGVRVTIRIGGLAPSGRHAVHIHEFGDLGADDASSAGGHFNPESQPHALPGQDRRHAGDLGNVEADARGNGSSTLLIPHLDLGAGRTGILGRAVIVHEKADDGGQPNGNSGARIGAGVIGISKDAAPDFDAVPVAPGTEAEPRIHDDAR